MFFCFLPLAGDGESGYRKDLPEKPMAGGGTRRIPTLLVTSSVLVPPVTYLESVCPSSPEAKLWRVELGWGRVTPTSHLLQAASRVLLCLVATRFVASGPLLGGWSSFRFHR